MLFSLASSFSCLLPLIFLYFFFSVHNAWPQWFNPSLFLIRFLVVYQWSPLHIFLNIIEPVHTVHRGHVANFVIFAWPFWTTNRRERKKYAVVTSRRQATKQSTFPAFNSKGTESLVFKAECVNCFLFPRALPWPVYMPSDAVEELYKSLRTTCWWLEENTEKSSAS